MSYEQNQQPAQGPIGLNSEWEGYHAWCGSVVGGGFFFVGDDDRFELSVSSRQYAVTSGQSVELLTRQALSAVNEDVDVAQRRAQLGPDAAHYSDDTLLLRDYVAALRQKADERLG